MRGADRELEAGAAAHYDDPSYYTQVYRHRTEDVAYYVDLARARGGPVLEYGCGNGRISIPMVQAGAQVVGVDQSAPMLADLRRKLGGLKEEEAKRLTLKRGDMRSVRLDQRFPLIFCPFNAFLHLYDRPSAERFLARLRHHLTKGGEFILDVTMPDPRDLVREPSRAYYAPRFRYPGHEPGKKGPMVRYSERFDYDHLRQILFVTMEFAPADGSETWVTPLAHRQFYPQELEMLLHYNGFVVTEQYGDFYKGPLVSSSETVLLHARSKGTGSSGRQTPM